MSKLDLLLVVPAICFVVVVLYVLAWALCVAASQADAHLESQEDERR